MADPGQLPPSVYQGLGWPQPDGMPVPMQPPGALGPPAEWGGLPPSVAQGLGWASPPASSSDDTAIPPVPPPPPAPTSLPSMAAPPPAAPGRGATPDYQVPASAFGGAASAAGKPGQPAPGAARAATTRPQTFDQRMGALDQREADTLAQQQGAIQSGVEAEKGLHADQAAAYRQMDQQVAANAAERKAENEQWAKIYATNEAKTDADRKQIESWKFNRNKFMDDLGVGGQVSWGIGAILAGVGNALQGIKGANPVIEMLQSNIHDANEQQMKERDALVQKLGMDRQTGLDARDYHATRQAEIDKADGLAYTALSKQIEEAAVKSADPMAQARGMKEAAELRAKSDELLKGSIQLRSQHDLQAQQNAITGGHLALAQKQFDWTKQKDQEELDLKAAALLDKKNGKLSEDESKRAIYIYDEKGTPIVARKSNGDPVLTADPADAAKIRKQVAAAKTYNTLVGQMGRGIKEHGGESDWWQSDDWQKMKTDFTSAVAQLHEAYGIESFREPTIEFFDKMVSAGRDPTAFNVLRSNAIAGLTNSNANLQTKINDIVGSQGYDGPGFAFKDMTSLPVPTQTDEQKITSDALLNPVSGFGTRQGKVNTELGITPAVSANSRLRSAAVASELKKQGGILPSVKQAMETWGAALTSPDLAIRRHYYQQLEKIAQESESPETAAFAQQLMDRAQERQMNETSRTPEVIRGASGQPRDLSGAPR